jgi:peptide chain release factor 2
MQGFPQTASTTAMEAERINAIANHLTDLQSRAGELRRYL